MNFIDIFVDFEEENNCRTMSIIDELHPIEDLEWYDMFVIDEFVNLSQFDEGEFEIAAALLETVDLWEGKELAPGSLLSLYKFYYNSFGLEGAIRSMHHALGCDCFKVSAENDKTLIRNFTKAINMYRDISSDSLDELYDAPPSGKIFFIYGKKIIIVYYVEDLKV